MKMIITVQLIMPTGLSTSFVHEKVDNFNVCQHPLITRLIKGILTHCCEWNWVTTGDMGDPLG